MLSFYFFDIKSYSFYVILYKKTKNFIWEI